MADKHVPSAHPSDRLLSLRVALGLKPREMAKRIQERQGVSVSRAHLHNIEHRKFRPGRDLALAIERELGIEAVSWGSATFGLESRRANA